MTEFYVYEWIRLDTNKPFYIGKGKKYRAWKLKNNSYFMNIYNKTATKVRIIKDNLDEQEAFELEKMIISLYKNWVINWLI